MKVYTLNPTYQLSSNTYVLTSGSDFAIIDPSANPETSGLDFSKVKYIILTHTHFDHMLFLEEWVKMTNAELIVGKGDVEGLTNSEYSCYKQFLRRDKTYNLSYREVSDGEQLPFGDEFIKVIETPGHTRGSITLYIDDSLFVGDTVFSRYSYGRCDLPGGDYHALQKSIAKIISYPESTRVYPGHGEMTTVRNLKK